MIRLLGRLFIIIVLAWGIYSAFLFWEHRDVIEDHISTEQIILILDNTNYLLKLTNERLETIQQKLEDSKRTVDSLAKEHDLPVIELEVEP